MKKLTGVLAGLLLVGSVWAQSDPTPPTFKAPATNETPSSAPSASSSALPPSTASGSVAPAPGPVTTSAAATPTANTASAYDRDAKGKASSDADADATASCDDSTYNQAQVHGTVSTGVAAGGHFTGFSNGGQVNISKHNGSCEDPKGDLSITVGGSVERGSIRRNSW